MVYRHYVSLPRLPLSPLRLPGQANARTDPQSLKAPNQETVQGARERKATRHQAVFGLDYKTWKDLVDAFDINEPLIPNRAAEASRAQVGRHGWYA